VLVLAASTVPEGGALEGPAKAGHYRPSRAGHDRSSRAGHDRFAFQAPAVEPRLGQPGKDVQWIPTPPALVEKMLDLARLTPADYLVDLGSGDGITVIAAAKRGARALGIEYDRKLVDIARRNAAAAQVGSRARFKRGDIFKIDFSDATVVTTFLLPSLNLQLRPTILAMKPGTRVVSNTFPMGEWEPDERASIEPCERWCTALLWIVPAHVAGTWRTTDGELTLQQHFQQVSGTLGRVPLADVALRADELRFRAGEAEYAGHVDGARINGARILEGRSTRWSAVHVDGRRFTP
jgi:SAM-dependent methyltransferase